MDRPINIQRLVESGTGLSYIATPDAQRGGTIGQTAQASSQTVVCIPGWCSRSDDFIPIFQTSAQRSRSGIRYLAVDLPGHGQSAKSISPEPNVPILAQLVIQFCGALQLKNVVLVGHSMGHRIIQVVAALKAGYTLSNHPYKHESSFRIHGLVLLDPTNYSIHRKTAPTDGMEEMTPAELYDSVSASYKAMFGPHTPPDFQTSSIQHLQTRDQVYMLGLRKQFNAYDFGDHTDVTTFLGRLMPPLPMLVIQGTFMDSQSRRGSFTNVNQTSEYLDWFKAKVPTAEIRIVLESGHFPHVDKPQECADAIGAFVQKLGPFP